MAAKTRTVSAQVKNQFIINAFGKRFDEVFGELCGGKYRSTPGGEKMFADVCIRLLRGWQIVLETYRGFPIVWFYGTPEQRVKALATRTSMFAQIDAGAVGIPPNDPSEAWKNG